MAERDLYKYGPRGSLRISVRILRIFDELDNKGSLKILKDLGSNE